MNKKDKFKLAIQNTQREENRPTLEIEAKLKNGDIITFIILKPTQREIIKYQHEIAKSLMSFKKLTEENKINDAVKNYREENITDDDLDYITQIEQALNDSYTPLAMKLIKGWRGVKGKHILEEDFHDDNKDLLDEDVDLDCLEYFFNNPDNFIQSKYIIAQIVGVIIGKMMSEESKKKLKT